ncbi:MAG TPA: hypothetical protein VFA32_00410 [Dehalococcoidia bacterium]|jgi:hypothetical protein|nr:hypothetical protein [Dehalococcoidia bacterium]
MPTEEQLLEIHRLALLGAEAHIAQDVTRQLAGSWLSLSRFREVRELCTKTLELGQDSPTLSSCVSYCTMNEMASLKVKLR